MVSKQRSYNMSRIKSKDTSIELKVRKYLYHKGYRYQKNVETFLAHSIIQSDLEPKKEYLLDYENNQCVLIQK